MRLFQTGGFYLHDSPHLSAEWLNDKDTVSYVRNASVLISTVIQTHTLERDTKLCPPDYSIMTDCSEVCEWAAASVYSMLWLIDYYEALCAKASRLFTHKPLIWEYSRRLKFYTSMGCFDTHDVNPRAWLPMSPSEARAAYLVDVRRLSFHKVTLPVWFPDSRPALPATAQPGACGSTLYLPELDLSPID